MNNLTTYFIVLIVFPQVLELYAQESKFRIFGQPGFDYTHNTKVNKGSPYFRGGPLVLLATSQLTDKISVAGELHTHYMAATGAEVEIERIYIRYAHKDHLNMRLGRMYTPQVYGI